MLKLQTMDIFISEPFVLGFDATNFEWCRIMKGMAHMVYSRADTVALKLVTGGIVCLFN